ncbi:growth/differentiatio [Chanos chanos]|uniref:Growth/differentiation factor 9 n=1 Tax=Chanos chanos TaxID=29144 RepID=A0A6J2UQ50_CHACN|nr:growth/differentiation factor 9 [Chanos chanos]
MRGALWYLNGIVILLVIGGLPHKLCQTIANEPVEFEDSSVHHGNILTPLLKALSEYEPWGDFTPRTRPESRYVRYMKRLYKICSKHERSHEPTHLYNTVRLITPRDECLEQDKGMYKEFFMQDLSYNLDRVRAQEELLKSVLLYSFDQDQASSFTSFCYLVLKEQEHSEENLCPRDQHSVRFHVQSQRKSRRKWVEVDVTPFLLPFVKSHKKDIHLLVNLTCADGGHGSGSQKRPVELTLRSPSLLLYLNDTSEVAYQRGPTSAKPRSIRTDFALKKSFERQPKFRWKRGVSRKKRNSPKDGKLEPSPETALLDLLPKNDFPTDDCDLYDFRVSFSQLKLDHWIIAPHKYNPRYCKGSCPRLMGYMYGSPVHTMVQNIIYEKLDSSVPRPSCVPSEYNPLSVLTIENDGSIAYKEYEEMIATKCTCR